MPINDNNDLVNQGSESINTATAMDELTPPQYGEHQFDRLYSDIDLNGYITPIGGPSGMSTPFTSRSRSVSSENLASLDGVASSDFAASVLQNRLSNLDVAGSSRVARDRNLDRSQLSTSGDGTEENGTDDSGASLTMSFPRTGSFANPGGDRSRQGSIVSRQVSEEDEVTSGPVTPQHIEYSAESLAKVPSYTTALRSPRRPINDGLPTYQSATQAPLQSLTIPQQAYAHRPMENYRDMLRRCS